MKRGLLLTVILSFVFIFAIGSVSAKCTLTTQLLNQEPYPAVPGDYVKLVFQVSGLQNPECNSVLFQLVPNYPISFDPGASSTLTLNSGTYAGVDYSSNAVIPFKVRVDPNALDGDNPIEIRYSNSGTGDLSSAVTQQFNLAVNDSKTDFDVFVKSFDFSTNQMTLEILNIGKRDVEALTVQIPRNQQNFTVKGSNVDIVGSLDSNDYSTASFEVSPNKGNLNLTIFYNDINGVRRSVNKTVSFDPSAFTDRKTAGSSNSSTGYVVVGILLVAIVGYIFYRRHKKNKKKRLLRE